MKICHLVTAALLALYCGNALAGATQPAPVEIDLENRFAGGDMVTARFSENDNELIGCGVRKIETGVDEIFSFAFCQARLTEEPEGLIICNTTNEALIEAIESISDFSYVTFSWNEDNECTRIGNSTQSFYIPNFKLKKNKK